MQCLLSMAKTKETAVKQYKDHHKGFVVFAFGMMIFINDSERM